MPLPVAHGLVGASILAASRSNPSIGRDWRAFLVAALLAILPDFDYFFIWVLKLGPGWHRSFTHSILFAVVIGALGARLVGAFRVAEIVAYVLATLSHTLIDALTTKENLGPELFWPLSTLRIKLGLFHYLDAPLKIGQQAWPIFLIGILRISLIELAVFAPLFLIILMSKRRRYSLRSLEEN